MKNWKVRLPMYFVGLFIMTIGVALSVKSNLGVSPVSSIPYTITCVWGIEMGKATILFHCALVLLQIILLRRRFKPVSLLQIAVGIVFGYFTTFCNYLAGFLPTTDIIAIRVAMVLISTVFVALGIFFYLPANVMPLAGEGAMQAVSQITGIEFSKVKIGFDCTMVIISMVTCLTMLGGLGSVGAGTIIAAILVGVMVGVFTKAFGRQRDRLLGREEALQVPEEANANEAAAESKPQIITISRAYGSGGRHIGKLLAEQLGYKYYDSELIRLAAQKSGYTTEYVEKNEQTLRNPLLHDFYEWYSGPLEQDELPKVDQLFNKEAEIIRELAAQDSCVIIGRLAGYILKDRPNVFNIFVSASEESCAKRIADRDNVSLDAAIKKVRKVNKERAAHCKYFAKSEWGDVRNYDLAVKADKLGIEGTAAAIEQLLALSKEQAK